jgi:hypothetical protein
VCTIGSNYTFEFVFHSGTSFSVSVYGSGNGHQLEVENGTL